LPLDESCIKNSIEIHRTLFLRSHEILRHLIIERTAFETFSTWLVPISEYVLSPNDDDPMTTLYQLDTVKIAEFISENFQQSILAKFSTDFNLDSSAMQVEGYDSYLCLVNGLTENMKRYFKSASGELKEGVSWVIPDWIDLEIHEEIVSSDMHIKYEVHPKHDKI
jgi:hypothetical protein